MENRQNLHEHLASAMWFVSHRVHAAWLAAEAHRAYVGASKLRLAVSFVNTRPETTHDDVVFLDKRNLSIVPPITKTRSHILHSTPRTSFVSAP